MKNRRRSRRYQVACPVQIKEAGGAEASLTADISAHGVAIFSDKARPTRQYVEMQIQIPTSTEPLKITAVVARIGSFPDPDGKLLAGTGLDFFLLDNSTKRAWQEFLFRLDKEGSSAFADLPSQNDVRLHLGVETKAIKSHEATLAAPGEKVGLSPLEAFENSSDLSGRWSYILKPSGQTQLWAFYREEIEQLEACLECPRGQSVGMPVDIILVHPDSQSEWILSGEVVSASRKDNGFHQIRIRLDELDGAGHKKFKTFVATGQGMIAEEVSWADTAEFEVPAAINTADLQRFSEEMDEAAPDRHSSVVERSSTLDPVPAITKEDSIEITFDELEG